MPKIDSALFGSFIVDGKKYESDIIVFWNGEVHKRKKSHNFTKAELADLLMYEPEIIIIGTGFSDMLKVDKDVELEAKLKGIELLIARTPDAVKEYNKLSRRKHVIAVLHSTC